MVAPLLLDAIDKFLALIRGATTRAEPIGANLNMLRVSPCTLPVIARLDRAIQ